MDGNICNPDVKTAIDNERENAKIRAIRNFYDECKKAGLTTEEILWPEYFKEIILAYIDEKLQLDE